MAINITDIHVGNLVREIIDARGIKQVHLAEKMGVATSTLSLMLDRPDWYISQIEKASLALDINLFSYFVESEDNNHLLGEASPVYLNAKMMKDLELCSENLKKEKERAQLLSENNGYLKRHNRELEIELNEFRKK